MSFEEILKRLRTRPKKVYVIVHPGKAFFCRMEDCVFDHPLVKKHDYPVPDNLKKRGE